VAKARDRDLVGTATGMVQSMRSVLAEHHAGAYPMSPGTRHRYEGALVALESLLGEPPSLLGEQTEQFTL
jgi:hypothetical protein